jgi:YesN/AraC family two-component response regulator
MDGLTLIREARPVVPDCTFVLMTAHDRFDAARAGVTVVSKPIRIAELLDAVAAAVCGLTRADAP